MSAYECSITTPLGPLKVEFSEIGLVSIGVQKEDECPEWSDPYNNKGDDRLAAVKTFVTDVDAQMSDEMRRAMVELIKMRWPGVEAELSEEDRAEFQRLCRPRSPDFILDIPDYYAFFTYTVFRGRVP